MIEAATVNLSKEIDTAPAMRDQAGAWPRFWSRLFDVYLWSFAIGLLIAFLFPEFFQKEEFEGPGGEALLGLFILPISLVVDAVILSLFGNTVGRALAGIRVETIRHEHLDISTALKRNMRLWFSGLALGIPLIALVTYRRNFDRLVKGDQTSWDEDLYTRVYAIRSNRARTWLVAVLAIALNIVPVAIEAANKADSGTSYEQGEVASDPVAEQLATAAAEVKPTMIDDITKLESADASGRTLTYHYSVLRRDVSDAQFERFFYEKNVPELCANSDIRRDLKDYQVTYRYEYSIPNADAPLIFDVTWDSCKQ